MGKESLVNSGMRLEETSIAVFNIMVTFSCKGGRFYANCNSIHLVTLSIAGVTEHDVG
jgi:hypothetical protein